MSEYKISIIVPIFNQEKYLKTAIDSVINQTIGFENIELILVDDKSTDSSREIINSYANQYSNIKPIFLNKNSGCAGIPKNKGIEKATGDYLMFFDPDDELLKDVCEILYDKITLENAEIVSGNAVRCVEEDGIKRYYPDIDYSNDLRVEVVPDKNYANHKNFRVWGSLFERRFILDNNIRFLDTKLNEDTYFAHKCYFLASKIVFLDNFYGMIYNFRQNSSLTQKYNKEFLLSTLKAYYEIKKLLFDLDVELEEDIFLNPIYERFGFKWDMSKDEKEEVYDEILRYKNINSIETKLVAHYKIIDKLLDDRSYGLLNLYQKLVSKLIKSSVVKKLLPKTSNFKEITPDSEVYKKLFG